MPALTVSVCVCVCMCVCVCVCVWLPSPRQCVHIYVGYMEECVVRQCHFVRHCACRLLGSTHIDGGSGGGLHGELLRLGASANGEWGVGKNARRAACCALSTSRLERKREKVRFGTPDAREVDMVCKWAGGGAIWSKFCFTPEKLDLRQI